MTTLYCYKYFKLKTNYHGDNTAAATAIAINFACNLIALYHLI